jgi:GntR family transcriptional repressor for pyruvate dehydrogenase complex
MVATASAARVGFEAIPRNRVYQTVAKQLERHITEELRPGDLLPPERELVRLLGVSRGSVRDAIRSLELMGLLEPRQGIGTVVRSPAAAPANHLANVILARRKLVAELLDVRKIIEPHLAARAARHASPAELADMEEVLIRQAAKIRSGDLAIEEDSEFHYLIALAADNSVILKVVDVLMDLLLESREQSLQGEGRTEKSLAGHHTILSALKRGNAVAAEAAMRRHLQEIESVVLKKL